MLRVPIWLLALSFATCLVPQAIAPAQDWPDPNSNNRPWVRWWWHGSAVDEANLTRQLEAFRAAGLGGVEITPIYGVRGQESRDIAYLSPRWIELANHAITEADRLGMQVDLPPGTGWRMGGPWVKPEDGNAQLEIIEGKINAKPIGEKVKRPAPGGEGLNINPYQAGPTKRFLDGMANKAQGLNVDGMRASFHDSFEYEGNWCDGFLDEFAARRGYRLEDELLALEGQGDPDRVARVKSDYRETISGMILQNLINPWVDWCHSQGLLARNQGHGTPGNWLDIYAACDIPETESFGRIDADPLREHLFKFASSAAHVAGRPLASSETATWLDEHFQVTLEQIKWIVDLQFLAGVNHVIFHGAAYSPEDTAWPGWVFYASTQLNPRNPIWRDAAELFAYITRCQSLLQDGKPDSDVLVYWPVYDLWHDPNGLMMKFSVHNGPEWLGESSLYRAVRNLDEAGVTYDFVSDDQLRRCKTDMGRVWTDGADYTAVLVPKTRHMPLATFKALLNLAETGAVVGFEGLPESPPGLKGLEQREEFNALKTTLQFRKNQWGLSSTKLGRGTVVLVDDPAAWARSAECRVESWSHPHHLSFIRRKVDVDVLYFIRNDADQPCDVWIAPATSSAAAVLMDPWIGVVGLAQRNDRAEYRLQLDPQQTVFLRTVPAPVERPAWQYRGPVESTVNVDGPWHVEFIAGGPTLPDPLTTDKLESWTKLAGLAGESFAGTARYTTTLNVPAQNKLVRLDLGHVADSARVFLNGREIGVLVGPSYAMDLSDAKPGENELAVEVTSVAANRIRDLDRRGVKWRIFKDINFVNIEYQPFDASNWPIRDAGLLGPVILELESKGTTSADNSE